MSNIISEWYLLAILDTATKDGRVISDLNLPMECRIWDDNQEDGFRGMVSGWKIVGDRVYARVPFHLGITSHCLTFDLSDARIPISDGHIFMSGGTVSRLVVSPASAFCWELDPAKIVSS